MSTFVVTAPDGRRFRVTAPEGATQEQVLAYAQQQMGDPRLAAAREANSGVGGFIDSTGRQVAQGATFGLMDEISAGLRTGAGLWGNYGETLAQERARDDTFRQDHPVVSAVANIAGGVAGPGRALGVLNINPAQRAASAATQFLRSGLARGTAAGAAGGALAGAGESEGVGGRLAGAAEGGALGGVLGGALGAGLTAGGQVAGRVLDFTGLRNPQIAADRQILRALERDNDARVKQGLPRLDPADLMRQPQGPGLPPQSPDMTLADMGGRNTVNLGAAAANTPGAAQEAADVMVQGRRMGRPDRVAGAVDDALGGGGGTRVADDVAALQQRRAAEAQPRYEAAFNRIVPTEEEAARVARFVNDPIGQAAMQRGLRVIEVEHLARNEPFNPAMFGVRRGENGQFELVEGFRNLRLMDAVKRGYDEIVEGFRDSTSGRLNLNQYGRAVNEARVSYVRDLRDMYPRYAGALDAWAGPSRSLDAISRGRQALRTDRDIVDRVVADLSPSDREFFRIGVGRAITDATADPARAVTFARRLIEDRQMQARLQTIIPDPAQRAQFTAALQREVEMAAVERAVSPRAGSQTARLQAGQDDMAVDPPGGMLAALLTGNTRGAIGQGLSSLYRRTQGINSSTADALAQRLLNTNQDANAETIRRLIGQRATDEQSARVNAALLARALRGVGVGAGFQVAD
jgi:hypothetical protein